jgi:hypothetical protein
MAERLLRDHDPCLLAEAKQRAKYLKEQFAAETGRIVGKEENVSLYWEAMWPYVDSIFDGSAVERLAGQPEPKPKASEVPVEPDELMPDASVFEGKDAPPLEAIQWAVEHAYLDGVTAEEAPSRLAWSIMCWAKKNAAQMNALFTTLLPKIVPKTKEEMGEGHSDDGKLIELLDAVERASEEAKGAS